MVNPTLDVGFSRPARSLGSNNGRNPLTREGGAARLGPRALCLTGFDLESSLARTNRV